MRPPASVRCERCLLIFDVHENVDWVRTILRKEAGRFDRLLLGGDYFDPHGAAPGAGLPATCGLLREAAAEFGPRLTVLLGNHDISYLEAACYLRKGEPIGPPRYRVSGFTAARAAVLAERLPDGFLADGRLFQVVNGWLASHAGVASLFWPPAESVERSIEILDQRCASALESLTDRFDPLLAAGQIRGGIMPVGGLTWLDFFREFLPGPLPPLPQVFGHTPTPSFLARRGNCWCLDGSQTRYGLLGRDGRLEVRES